MGILAVATPWITGWYSIAIFCALILIPAVVVLLSGVIKDHRKGARSKSRKDQ